MADVEDTGLTANGGTDPSLEDGDDAESNVWLRCPENFTLARQLIFVYFLQEIMLMKQRVAEMEREANKLRELQAAAEAANSGDDGSAMETEDDKSGADNRSVYVGNVRIRSLVTYMFSLGI